MELYELRIGNFVTKIIDGKETVIKLTGKDIAEAEANNCADLRPLILTRERAEQFGFKPIKPNKYRLFNFYDFDLVMAHEHAQHFSAVKSVEDGSVLMVAHMVMYVHQLQNLYLGVTKYELSKE